MKKLTKTEREEQQKQQLRRRLLDIAYGANGGCSLECCDVEYDFYSSMGAEVFFRFMRAVRSQFPLAVDCPVAYEIWNLANFENVDKAVEYLWDKGARP